MVCLRQVERREELTVLHAIEDTVDVAESAAVLDQVAQGPVATQMRSGPSDLGTGTILPCLTSTTLSRGKRSSRLNFSKISSSRFLVSGPSCPILASVTSTRSSPPPHQRRGGHQQGGSADIFACSIDKRELISRGAFGVGARCGGREQSQRRGIEEPIGRALVRFTEPLDRTGTTSGVTLSFWALSEVRRHGFHNTPVFLSQPFFSHSMGGVCSPRGCCHLLHDFV